MSSSGMTSLADILETIFRPASCDFCPSAGPTYADPETGCRYCLTCLEAATETLDDGPEDMEVTALGLAVLDQLLPLAA